MKPAVIVDRDGVINAWRHESVLRWEDFVFRGGALDGLALLAGHGYRVVVVTNQASVGRGLLTLSGLRDIHARMLACITAAGGAVEAIYVCEHPPEQGCRCRKPGTELLTRAAADLGFELRDAWVIGDNRTDMEAARGVGAHTMLVLGGAEGNSAAGVVPPPELVVPDLAAAAVQVVARCSSTSARRL